MREHYLKFLKTRPVLAQLRTEFPGLYEEALKELVAVPAESLSESLRQVVDGARAHQDRIDQSGLNAKVLEVSFPKMVKARILVLLLQNQNLRTRTGRTGRIAFNRFNGSVLQWLLFEGQGFQRKPVSKLLFSVFWPLLPQRSFLMPLVNKKGIYCFYSGALIASLSRLLRGHRCVEVAAGDGTLTRMLQARGLAITASDDKSWAAFVDYPQHVETLTVQEALKRDNPSAVLCSWPPLDNAFEASILAHKTVELYVVIGGPECGNRKAWQDQSLFDRLDDAGLSRSVLPPELNSVVSVFRRRKTATRAS